MSFQTPITIKQVIDKIDSRKYLLPAIQREFVWDTYDIELLFDSLMCGFPINSFLFWNVTDTKNKTKYKYYQFMTEFIEYHNEVATPFNTAGISDFYAVLDGQQRLTALYLGLKGSFAYKNRHGQWKNMDNFPPRMLYMDITKKYTQYSPTDKKEIAEYDDEREYNFCFLTENEFNDMGGATRFFRVGDILNNEYINVSDMMDTVQHLYPGPENKFARDTIAQLHNIIYTKPLINYYLEETDDYDKALKIFIRTNNGGQKLTFSDLLISTIISNWTIDARKEFSNLEKEIRGMDFYGFPKDFIVRCALMIYGNDIRFKINNLSQKWLNDFENNWNDENGVKAAIKSVFTLLKTYGYTEKTITSYNALAPIVYYLSVKKKTKDFCNAKQYKQDRIDILKWLNIVFLKRTFGGQSDAVLKEIRDVIAQSTAKSFPITEIKKKLEGTRKSLSVDDEFLDSLLVEQMDSPYAFPILALLYPSSGNHYRTDKDHIHPKSKFNEKDLKALKIPEDDWDFYTDKQNWNSVLNLQLLSDSENKSKLDKTLNEWIATQPNFDYNAHIIPKRFTNMADFRKFIAWRQKHLKDKLRAAFE